MMDDENEDENGFLGVILNIIFLFVKILNKLEK